jgi:hypothetical protein
MLIENDLFDEALGKQTLQVYGVEHRRFVLLEEAVRKVLFHPLLLVRRDVVSVHKMLDLDDLLEEALGLVTHTLLH